MRIAKAAIDVGLHTNNKDPLLAFWQDDIGLPFHETLPVGRGVHQLRHGIGDSVLKINHNRDPLPPTPPTGLSAPDDRTAGVTSPRELIDPDGNRVTLVPPGHDGIEQLQVDIAVRDVGRAPRFLWTCARTRVDRRRTLSLWCVAALV